MNNDYHNALLLEEFQKYNFESLNTAIFCLLSWRDNRSVINTALTLNQILIDYDYEQQGSLQINNYETFNEIYGIINNVVPVLPMQDLTVNDFGEVVIKFEEEVYPIIVGNGYEFTYEAALFASYLSKYSDNVNLIKDALRYSRFLIYALKPENKSAYDTPQICFDLPGEAYFTLVQEFVISFRNCGLFEDIIEMLCAERVPVEKAHFLKKNLHVFPLFNSSLIVDAFRCILDVINPEKIPKYVEHAIVETVHSNFNAYNSENPHALYPAQIVNERMNGQIYFSFVGLGKESLIIAINMDIFPEDIVKRDIERLKKYHEHGTLILGEIKRRKNGQALAIEIPKHKKIQIIGYNTHVDVTEPIFIPIDKIDCLTATAFDLMLILNDIESFEEFADFIEQYTKDKFDMLITLSGLAGLYLMYKGMHGTISEGAFEPDLLNVSYDFPAVHTIDLFTNEYCDFPFEIKSKLFQNPHQWKIKEDEFGFKGYIDKAADSFFGHGKRIGDKGFCFFAHNSSFLKNMQKPDNFFDHIRTVDELNQRYIARYEEDLAKISPFNDRCIQLLYMPYEYACKVDNTGFTKLTDRKYVFSECRATDPDHIIVRYAVQAERLFNDIMESVDNSVEIEYYQELISSLQNVLSAKDYEHLVQLVAAERNRKKTVDILQISIDYQYNSKGYFKMPDIEAFKIVRKDIAKICHILSIEPGIYEGQQARNIVRKMQTKLVGFFEEKLATYNRAQLHQQALAHISAEIHEKKMAMERFSADLNNLEELISNEFRSKAVEIREKSKKNYRSLLYLIESNLFAARISDPKYSELNADEYDYLVAFADWLVVLQDNSDMAHFGFDWTSLEVTYEYNINTNISAEGERKWKDLTRRHYNSVDYGLKGDEEDKKHLLYSAEAFKSDLGFSLAIFFDVLNYLSWHYCVKSNYRELEANVIAVAEQALVADIVEVIGEDIPVEEVSMIIDYLTLDPQKLKTYGGSTHDILPIWERENRINRFDQKPLVVLESQYVFSPVFTYDLHQMWKYGLTDFYPPFIEGMEKMMEVLEIWKRRYEKQMVYDLCAVFEEVGFKYIFPNRELHTLDKGGHHPTDLGDYDLLAIDDTTYVIWNIECKVLKKVGSIYEEDRQQRGFFRINKYDQKFQRRIDYLEKHKRRILESIGIDSSTLYEVKSYIVTNKVFAPRIKTVSYPFLSFDEIEKEVRRRYPALK